MDNHHVLNDPLAGMGMNGGGRGDGQSYRQMGQQPQQQNHQQQYNDFAVDPSLIGDSWQQPGQSYGHAGHQDVFSPPPQHQQPTYGQYGHSPQPQQFSYGQPQHQQPPQPVYPTQYASIYGQTSHSPVPRNGAVYDNQFGGMPNNAHSIMNGDLVQSRGFQSFDRAAASLPYPSASRGPTPTQTIAPHDLDRDIQYLGQSRNNSTPQQAINGDVNNLFDQSWSSQPEYHAAVVPERPQQVLAATPEAANHSAAPPQLPATKQSTSKPSSPAPQHQSVAGRKKKDEAGLRITHADLLAQTDNVRRFENAPFLLIDSRTVELPDKLAHKALPSWQVKTNRSGRPLVEGLHERLSSRGRVHKELSSRKKYQASGLTKTERLKTASATGSGTNSPRPSIDSETESSEYTSSEEDSDYSSDDDEIMDLRTLEEVRPEPRPADIAEAAAWDAFTIMYSPAGRRPHPDERKTVGQRYPELISKLREQLIKVNTDLAAAEAQRAANAKDLKVEQKSREQALVKALRVAIDSPHQDLRDTLFSFDKFVVIMGNALRMVVKSDDYFGDLAMAVLELMSTYKFKGAGKDALERAKFPQIAKRFKSRAENKAVDVDTRKRQEDIKRFIKTIEESQLETKPEPKRVGAFSCINQAAAKPDENTSARPDNNPLRAPIATAPRYEGTSALKRAREPDNSTNIPNKRTTPTGENNKPAAKPSKTISLGPAKPASSFFSKLGKQAPKPATITSAATAAKPVVKKPAPPQAPRPSVLGSLLDSINAPKEEPKKVEAVKRAPETLEEKKKRERKESRRHLRVKFKEEGLEEIRLFTHEKAEDEGRDVDMLRDAHDDRSEGMMLKQRLEDVIDDEDTDMAEAVDVDINNRTYPDLCEIDFSVLEEEVRNKNTITRGGRVEFRTPQQEIQEKREATELMVVYTDEADIPASSKEPSSLSTGNKNPALFGHVKDQTIKDRLRDIQFSGDEVAYFNMMSQLEEKLQKKTELEAKKQALASGPEQMAAILDAIKTKPTIDVRDFYVPPGMDKDAMANLYRVFAAKKGLPFPAKQAPEWMRVQMQQSWYEGVAREEARRVNIEAEKKRMVAEEEARKMFEARQQAQFAPPAPFMGAPPMGASQIGGYSGLPAPPVDPSQMAQMMASMGYPGATPPPLPQWGAPPPAGFPSHSEQFQNSNPNSYPGNQNNYDQGQGGWGNDAYGNNRRNNNYGDESSDNMNNNKKRKWGKGKNKQGGDGGQGQYGGEKQHDRDPDYKRKTIECLFYKQGKCMKGEGCTFIHDRN